jgi:hypothetical protein
MASAEPVTFELSASTSRASASPETALPNRVAGTRPESRKWILGRAGDAFFIANIFWPVLLLLQYAPGFEGRSGIQFWQLYFITTPHRWSTLVIVLLDRERFLQRKRTYVAIAAIVVITCLGVRMATGTLTCLLAVDYLWNAWHFAAQHHGIYRIYGRLGSDVTSAPFRLEKWLFRSFLLYVIFRTASAASAPWEIDAWLRRADWFSLVIPAWLVSRELKSLNQGLRGRSLYLFSLLSLYVSLLWAVHVHQPALVLSLATASAWFHASEYLAVISWHIQRRAAADGANPVVRWLAPRWGIALLLFAVILGSGAWLLDHELFEFWLTLNVIAAFLHYSYDGMIWKSGRSAVNQGRVVSATGKNSDALRYS